MIYAGNVVIVWMLLGTIASVAFADNLELKSFNSDIWPAAFSQEIAGNARINLFRVACDQYCVTCTASGPSLGHKETICTNSFLGRRTILPRANYMWCWVLDNRWTVQGIVFPLNWHMVTWFGHIVSGNDLLYLGLLHLVGGFIVMCPPDTDVTVCAI